MAQYFMVDTRNFGLAMLRFRSLRAAVAEPREILKNIGRYMVASTYRAFVSGQNPDGTPWQFKRTYADSVRRKRLATDLKYWIFRNTVRVGWQGEDNQQLAQILTQGSSERFIVPRFRQALSWIDPATGRRFFSKGHKLPAIAPVTLTGLREYNNDSRNIAQIIEKGIEKSLSSS